MNGDPDLCIYHGNCADGFTSAWAVWRRYADTWPHSLETRRAEAFSIALIDYDAVPHVDDVPWGARSQRHE